MRFLHPQLLLGTFFLLSCATLFAQQGSSLCSNTALVPVFKQTFGKAANSTAVTTAPPGSTNYIFGTVSTDGQYIVTPLVENASKSDWTKGGDHTGDTNGNMFLVNAGGSNSIFLQQTVSGLCSGSSYSFSAWLANVNTPNTQTVCGAGLVYPKIKFNIRDSANNILGTYTTGNLPLSPINGPLNWQKYGFQFDLPSNTTSLKIEIVDFYGGGAACGNDVALDDILFEACIPQITISLNSSSDSICAGGNVSLRSTLINSPYTNPAYQWQKKNMLTTNWEDVSSATTGAGLYNFNNATLGDAGLYRVLVAPNISSITNATCSAISNGVAFTVNPLPYLSPTYNAPVCSGKNLLLKANPSNGSGVYNSFKWTGPQLFKSFSADTTLTLVKTNAGGMYNITTTDSKGCSANADIFVQIDSTPVLNYISVTDTICSGNNAKVVVNSSLPSSGFYWEARLLSGSVTGSGPVVNPEYTGIKQSILINNGTVPARVQYAIYAQSTAGCKSNTLDSIVTILPLPTTATAGANMAICNKTQASLIGNSPTVGTGFWKQLSGPNIVAFTDSTLASTIVKNLLTGTYTFSWNISNNCITNSDTIQINNIPKALPSFTLSDTVVCGPAAVSFTNTSNQDSFFQYNWNFGNGQQSTSRNPGSIIFQPSVSGNDTTYTITLTIHSLCDTAVFSKQIKVQRKPFAAFTAVKQNNCLPLLVNFANSSAGTATQYKYIFGDGKDTTAANFTTLSHQYFAKSDTNFNALLIATNQCGADTATRTIQAITNPLKLNTNFADTAVCGVPFTLNINNNSSGALEYNWNWGDGSSNNSSTNSNIQHTYQQAGSYTVTHALKTICSDTTITKTIHIYPSVKALINAIPTNKCLGDTIKLQSTSDNSLLFKWKANDSILGSTQQLLFPTTQIGFVNFKLLVSKIQPFATCIDSTAVSSTINPIPYIQFTTVTSTVCSGNKATIALSNSVNNSAYYWSTVSTTASFSGWIIGTNPESTGSKTFTLSNTGANIEKLSHNIYAISNKGCRSNTLDTIITISPIPDKATAGTDQLLCNKTQATLIGNSPTVGTGFWKQLSGPNIVAFTDSTLASTIVKNLLTGTYTFSWNISNNCITNSDTIQINNIPKALPSFTLSDTVVCGPAAVSFTNTSNQDSFFQYNWNFGNGQQSTSRNPGSIIFQPSVSGNDTTYTITLTIHSLCDTAVFSKQIKVQRKPFAAFTAVKQNNCLPLLVNFANSSAGTATQYKYIFGDGKDTTAANFTSLSHQYFAKSDTNFNALLIATNQCGADTATRTIQAITNPLKLNTNFADTAVCGVPFTLNINNNSSGAVAYNWNWGDGSNNNFTSNNNIQHTYQQAGSYTVTHALKTICSDTTITKTIHIYPSVKALINAIPTDKCLGDTIKLSSSSDSTLSYQWKVNGNAIGTQQILPYSFSIVGNYQAQLIVRKIHPQLACIDSTKQSFNIIGERKGSLTVAPTTGYCTPFTVQLVNNSQPAASVTWSTGDGNSTTGDTASYTFINSGDYWVQLKAVTAGGCVYKDSTLVQVKSPRGTFEFKGGAYCNGNNKVLFTTNTTYNTDLVEWNFGDGIIKKLAPGPISHTYIKEGIYHPTLTLISNTGCRIVLPAKDSVIIESIKAKFTVSTVYECGQTNFNFFDSSRATFGISGYEWLLNNKALGNNNKATALFKQTGTHETSLIVTSKYGCTDSIRGAYKVSIYSYPKVNINSINEACLNNLMELKSEVSSIDSVIYRLWNLGNGQKASDSSVRILYFDEGKYTVQLTVATINKCLDSALKQITIHPVPIIKVASDQKICSGDSITLQPVGATNYVWKDQQENIICNNCLTLKVRPQKTTSYKVIGYNEFGCTQVAATNVQVIERPKIKALAADTICIGENVQLWVSGASTYQWLPDAGLNNYLSPAPIAAPLITTTYKVVGKDQQNCFTDTAYTKVVVGNPTPLTVGRDTNFIAGAKIQLRAITAQNNIQKYVWSGGADLSCVNCSDPVARVVYDECISCKVTNIYGCTSTDTVCIKTFCPTTEVFIPNAFTPDGDGVNDILFIQAKGVRTIKSFRIFSRWGEPVFEKTNFLPNDANAGWNGKIKGNNANPDVYVYICEVICERGASQFYKGNIAILK